MLYAERVNGTIARLSERKQKDSDEIVSEDSQEVLDFKQKVEEATGIRPRPQDNSVKDRVKNLEDKMALLVTQLKQASIPVDLDEKVKP